MRIQPVSSPYAIPQNGTPESVRTAKAVAAFNAGRSSYDAPAPVEQPKPQAQETPVANPNNISPEELSAVKAPTPELDAPAPKEEATSTPEPVKEEPKDPALSRQFAQLARQERALRAKVQQQQQQLKQREAELTAKETAIKAKEAEYANGYISLDELKRDTLNILTEKAGVTYDSLTQQLLNRGEVSPAVQGYISKLEEKIAKLEQGYEESKKQQAQVQQEQRQAAIRQITIDATDLIKSNPIAYEAINKIGPRGIKETVRLITETYDKKGRVMSVEEAADEVENYLVEENYNMASSISKIKKRLAEAGQPRQPEQKTQSKPADTTPMKTLTNAVSSTRKLTAKERAILAFKGELKD